MLFRDAMRAQYYLKEIQQGQERLRHTLETLYVYWPTLATKDIIEKVSLQLADWTDQILLPVIAHEIERAKVAGILVGDTPSERYDNFFLGNGAWTSEARRILLTYPFLFEMIQTFIKSSVDNLCHCLKLLKQDLPLIRKNLLDDDSPLSDIYIPGSDRHRGGKQAIVLTFASGSKIIFKPTDLTPDQLFRDFITDLRLPQPYDLYCMRVLPQDGYGWLEYLPNIPCLDLDELRNFYRRAGVLLAVTDALNYCDGHFDNLIAFGSYPVLIDCETLFHSFGEIDPELGERSILFTGLVQKPPKKDSGRGFTAALQTLGTKRFAFLHTYAVNDHTDKLAVRFRGITEEVSHNCPIFEGRFQTTHNFIEEFVEGFTIGYDQISRHWQRILDDSEWWRCISRVRARQLIRHTLYYQLLIRKIQQPEGCVERSAAVDILQPLLNSEMPSLQILTDYELTDLLYLDIPYFYHYPGNCDLYDGQSKCYPRYFERSAVEEMRKQFAERSENYRDRSIAILRNVLPASPIPAEV
jgi:type 2 lantibiotic biosynthesis protein LanM